MKRGKPHCRSSIPPKRLEEQIALGEFRKLRSDQVGMRPTSHHQNLSPGHDEPRPPDRGLKKRLVTNQTKKRLGLCART
jgi:hypothetical protein